MKENQRLKDHDKKHTKDCAVQRAISQQPQASCIGWNISSNLATTFCTQIQWHGVPWFTSANIFFQFGLEE